VPHAILLDTDIGTDIDDAYALTLAAASPEVDLRGVTTVNNDTVLRARIARKLLNLLDRSDVPVIAGAAEPLTPGVGRGWLGHEGEGIDLADTAPAGDFHALDSVARILHTGNEARVTLVTIGALTNVVRLLALLNGEERPRIERIVAMASTFEGYGPENARIEHNVACDPLAFRQMIESGIPVTLVGLNVTRQTTMTTRQVDDLESIGGPLACALVGMHRVWFRKIGKDQSPMHDALAVACVFRPDLLTTIPVVPSITGTDGAVVYNPPAAGQVTSVDIAVDADVGSFHDLLWARTLQAARASRNRAGDSALWIENE
jgi:purine nucleosidase